jgi:hypothetical protein
MFSKSMAFGPREQEAHGADSWRPGNRIHECGNVVPCPRHAREARQNLVRVAERNFEMENIFPARQSLLANSRPTSLFLDDDVVSKTNVSRT